MQAKKDLARRIVADFHSAEAAQKAEEDWAKQFQKKEVLPDADLVSVGLAEIGGFIYSDDGKANVPVDRLLVKCGLAASRTDAGRKVKQGSVRLDDHVLSEFFLILTGPPPIRLPLRVGKQLRIAVVNW
jgi:tyrosyl-tRNA synthetase